MKNQLFGRLWKYLSFFLSFLFLFQITSCTYFKVVTTAPSELSNIEDIGEGQKYYVLHSYPEKYSLKNIRIDSNVLYGTADLHDKNMLYSKERKKHYKRKERSIIKEVHIYLNSKAKIENPGNVQIALNDIHEIRVIDKNTGLTIASHVFTIVGILAIIPLGFIIGVWIFGYA